MHSSLIALALLLTAACNGGAPPRLVRETGPAAPKATASVAATAEKKAEPVPVAAPALDPALVPALYAPLFEKGRAFRYHVDRENSHYDPDDPAANRDGTVAARDSTMIACNVVDVRAVPGALIATLDCGAEANAGMVDGMGNVTPAGHWIATPAGLYRIPWDEPVPASFSEGELVLPIAPKAFEKRQKNAEGEESDTLSNPSAGSWCREKITSYGDSGYDTFCFESGVGLVRQVGGWDGGSSHSATFELIR